MSILAFGWLALLILACLLAAWLMGRKSDRFRVQRWRCSLTRTYSLNV